MASNEYSPLLVSEKASCEHPMIKLLKNYHSKLTNQESQYTLTLSEIKQQLHLQFQTQLNLQFSIFKKQFQKQKHHLSTELKTVEYYLQNFIQKHSLNPRENNLYPLFNEIDQKLNQNLSFIKDGFRFEFRYPETKNQINQKLTCIKAEIMEKELQELRSFLAHNQNIRKYCNKELKQIKDIHDSFGQIYFLAQKQYFTPELNFTGTLDQVMLTLKITKNIEKLNLGIKSNTGKMSVDELKQLLNRLIESRNLLTHVNIKIMDMEFEEQKCNLIKSFVKQLKVIKSFKLQNYYRENKLGMFEDFNWYPLKKETHIIGKVW